MVQTLPPGGVRDPFDTLEGGGKAISWATTDPYGNTISVPPGTYHDIEVTTMPTVKQDTHFDGPEKGQPKFYSDGNPVESFVLTGKVVSPTVAPEDENDDLVRTDYFRNQKRRALQDAFKAIGVRPGDGFGIGTVLRITLTGLKPTQKGQPQKLFDVQFLKYVPRSAAAFTSLESGQPAQAAPGQYVTPTQWAQPAPQAPPPAQQYAPPAPPQPVAQQAPAQAPQPVQAVQPGVAAVQAVMPGAVEIPQQQAPAAPQQVAAPAVPAGGAPAVLQAHVDKVTMAINVGIDRAGAIQAVASEVAPGNEGFRAALDNHIPI